MFRPITILLADGSAVLVRPISRADRTRLQEALARLSPASRYRRFLTERDDFSERELDYLTDVDHHDHEALVALDAATGEAVGVARYIRTGSRTAEVAVTVADAWQGRGLGSRLTHLLALRARQVGIRSFTALTLATNREAIRLLEQLGRTRRFPAGPYVQLTTRLRGTRALRRRTGATGAAVSGRRRGWYRAARRRGCRVAVDGCLAAARARRKRGHILRNGERSCCVWSSNAPAVDGARIGRRIVDGDLTSASGRQHSLGPVDGVPAEANRGGSLHRAW
jgi:RimJ/RimL family protein N-acetyltransferase